MTNLNEKSTKYTGYYRCPDDIRNFKIRIRFREVHSVDNKTNRENQWLTKDFSWQEKHFSTLERDFYGDVNNCVSDLEKIYNEKIVNASESNEEGRNMILFTYVNQDGFVSDQEITRQTTYLQNMVENVAVDTENKQGRQTDYDYQRSLQTCIENPVLQSNFEKMYIMADFGEYVEEIWIKNEQTLCIIKFDTISKVLSVYPDFTTTKPYSMKVHGDNIKNIQYFIENGTADFPESQALKEKDTIQKVTECKRALVKRITGDKFFLPPKNKLYVYLFFEILSAKNFENNDLYVEYSVDLPEHWSCEKLDSLKGLTQTCHATTEDGLVHFGHDFEVMLQYDIQSLEGCDIPKNPYIYFEVISRSTWDRYTTEGLTYRNLPVSKPGCYFYNLSCFRFDTRGPSGGLRRFFIGDAKNYKDIKWIGLPQQQSQINVLNKYGVNTIGTGQLSIRLNVLHQSQAFLKEFYEGDQKEKYIYEKLNASSLIRSVNQVLLAFRKARRNLVDARKEL